MTRRLAYGRPVLLSRIHRFYYAHGHRQRRLFADVAQDIR